MKKNKLIEGIKSRVFHQRWKLNLAGKEDQPLDYAFHAPLYCISWSRVLVSHKCVFISIEKDLWKFLMLVLQYVFELRSNVKGIWGEM